MPSYRRKSHLLKLEFTFEYKESDLGKDLRVPNQFLLFVFPLYWVIFLGFGP